MNDISRANMKLGECLRLMENRASKYGDSWKDARISSLVDYVLMKYNRLRTMTATAELIKKNKDKIKSDLQDAVNYAIFVIMKLEEQK